MTTKNYKAAANEMIRIASAYTLVYNCNLIESDMKAYAGRIAEYRDAMVQENSKFSYTDRFYIRHRGVESTKQRVDELHDQILATVEVCYDKNSGVYNVNVYRA